MTFENFDNFWFCIDFPYKNLFEIDILFGFVSEPIFIKKFICDTKSWTNFLRFAGKTFGSRTFMIV